MLRLFSMRTFPFQDLLQDKEEREAAKTKKAADVENERTEKSKARSPPSPPLLTTRSGRQIRWKGATSILLNAKQQSSTAAAASNQTAITDSQWVAALDACEDDENDRAAAKRALDEAKVLLLIMADFISPKWLNFYPLTLPSFLV